MMGFRKHKFVIAPFIIAALILLILQEVTLWKRMIAAGAIDEEMPNPRKRGSRNGVLQEPAPPTPAKEPQRHPDPNPESSLCLVIATRIADEEGHAPCPGPGHPGPSLRWA